MTPQGKVLKQKDLAEMVQFGPNDNYMCGQYEGFDERIRDT